MAMCATKAIDREYPHVDNSL